VGAATVLVLVLPRAGSRLRTVVAGAVTVLVLIVPRARSCLQTKAASAGGRPAVSVPVRPLVG
jgi:hypothetical protein